MIFIFETINTAILCGESDIESVRRRSWFEKCPSDGWIGTDEREAVYRAGGDLDDVT